MTAVVNLPSRACLGSAVDDALATLDIAYQPIVGPVGQAVGHEVLVRPRDTRFPSPLNLVHAAEATHRIVALGHAVRHLVARDLETRLAHAGMIWVNVHPHELSDPTLGTGALARHSHRIVLEITEAAELPPQTEEAVLRLRGMGYLVALDDVGAGPDALQRIAQVQPDAVKLDRSLVAGLDDPPWKARYVRTIVQVCRTRGIPVLAEGVEEAGAWARMRELGCRLFQGYLFGKPKRLLRAH